MFSFADLHGHAASVFGKDFASIDKHYLPAKESHAEFRSKCKACDAWVTL
jgi:hypothetical protein